MFLPLISLGDHFLERLLGRLWLLSLPWVSRQDCLIGTLTTEHPSQIGYEARDLILTFDSGKERFLGRHITQHLFRIDQRLILPSEDLTFGPSLVTERPLHETEKLEWNDELAGLVGRTHKIQSLERVRLRLRYFTSGCKVIYSHGILSLYPEGRSLIQKPNFWVWRLILWTWFGFFIRHLVE